MALITRIFQNRNKSRNQSFKWTGSNGKEVWTSPRLDKSQIRLVLFRDHDIKGRKLLFDSAAVQVEPQKQCTKTNPKVIRHEKGPTVGSQHQGSPDPSGMLHQSGNRYSYTKPSSDIDILGEMMHGSVAMSYRGSTLKVHEIRSPPQMMISKVFMPAGPHRDTITSTDGDRESMDDYSISSISSDSAPRPINDRPTVPLIPLTMAQSIPVEIPSPPRRPSMVEDDSGIAASVSVASSASSVGTSFPSPGSASSSLGSYSLHRRWKRSFDTSLEYNFQKRQSEENMMSIPASKRPCKFGLGVIVKLPTNPEERRHFEKFLFSHITLIESHVNKLQVAIERVLAQACGERERSIFRISNFIHNSLEGSKALDTFRESLFDLYMAPRLTEPVWLNMMCFSMQRVKLCQRFLKDFMGAIEKLDTKNNKFFISSMLTAVLTYHLAWIPTVTPAGAVPSRTYLDKHTAKWLDTLARSHPYNPLWAQLGDLYGAIGFPLRLCRTVVVGKKADIVCKMLYILSYFIRCSEVLESRMQCPLELSQSGRAEDAILTSDMSPIRESGLSRNNSKDSMSDIADGLVADLEVAMEAGESPPSNDSDVDVKLPTDTIISLNQSLAETSYSPPNAPSRSVSECTVINSTDSPMSPFRTESESTVTDFDTMENSTMFKSDSTVISDQSDKTLSPSTSCNHLEQTVSDTMEDSRQEESSSVKCDTNSIEDSAKSGQYGTHGNEDECDSANTEKACKLSQNSVEEMPKVENTRHLGSDVQLPTNVPRDFSLLHEQIDQYSQDSGVFDGNSTESQTLNTKSCAEELLGTEDSEASSGEKQNTEASCDDIDQVEASGVNVEIVYDQDVDNELPSKDLRNITFSRHNSMFDEYFPDGNTTPTGLPKVLNRPAKLIHEDKKFKRMGSIEGSNSYMDEYINVPLPDFNVNGKESSPERERISLKEGHFEDESQFIAITGNAKEQVKHAIQLMKQSSREDVLSSVELGASGDMHQHKEETGSSSGTGKKSRPNSLTLKSVTRPLSRQNSNNKTPTSSKRSGRSTPVESGRRRHASSLSTASSIDADFFLNLQELPMSKTDELDDITNKATYERHFGRSLMAAYTDHYMSDFVLHGTSDTNFHSRLHNDLRMSVQNSVVDEQIAESVCIIADTDKWSVQVHSCQYSSPDRVHKEEVMASHFVLNIIDSLRHLNKLKMSPESCLMHLEDRLQEIYFKSLMLGEYMCQHKKIDMKELSVMLGFDSSDLPLLLAVAGTHTPHLAMGLHN